MAKIVHYGARTLAVLFAAFLSIFILEGFGPDFGWQAGVMHAILAAIAIALAAIAFRWPLIGGWLYVGIALVLMSVFLATSPMNQNLAINPLVGFVSVIGVLFLVDARLTKQQKKPAS